MSVEAAVYDYLSTEATFAGLLGGVGDDCRLFPQRLPQDPEYPSAVYRLISAPRGAYTHDNAGSPPQGTTLVNARVQFDLWAAKDTDGAYEELLPVEAALVAALSGFKGTMGSMEVQRVFIDNAIDGFEPDTGSNKRMVDAILTYEEG